MSLVDLNRISSKKDGNFKLLFLILFASSNLQNVLCNVAHKRPDTLSKVIDVNDGKLQGLERQTAKGTPFFSFKGIPYAEPPINDLRFKDPIPVKPWTGVRNATKDGNYCPQHNVVMGDLVGEEDCLFLNVYTPRLPNNGGGKRNSVLVNIHSGGFTMGAGVEDEFNPENFIDNDIVVVSINYRLGIFGFLSLDTPEVPGNAALKDQRLSLKWIKNNIHFFNGDPEDITIIGISAGGTSAEYHLLHPDSKGLFQRVSMQSGTALSSWARPRSQIKSLEKLADYFGIFNDPNEILERLNNLTTMQVLDAASKSHDNELRRLGYVFTQFTPVLEKQFPNVESFITKDPLEIYKSGHFLKVPTLRTFCRDEGTVFQFMYGTELVDEIADRKYADFMSFLNIANKSEVNGKLTSLYKTMGVSKMDEVHEFLSDMMFLSGIYQSLKYITKDEALNHYTYMFSYVGDSTQEETGDALGKVPHTIDISYFIFLNADSLTVRDLNVRKYLSDIFIGFIKNGDPTANGKIQWEPSKEANGFKILDIHGDENKVMSFPFEERMKYWDTLYG